MLPVLLIGAALIALASICQYEIMQHATSLRLRMNFPRRFEVVAMILVTVVAHGFNVVLYALAFWWLHHHPAFGTLIGEFTNGAQDFLYFSLTCYTSLGFGDIYPEGDVRILAGLEALNGLVLIAWSASFTFLSVSRGFDGVDK
jgi:hypothetical protein